MLLRPNKRIYGRTGQQAKAAATPVIKVEFHRKHLLVISTKFVGIAVLALPVVGLMAIVFSS